MKNVSLSPPRFNNRRAVFHNPCSKTFWTVIISMLRFWFLREPPIQMRTCMEKNYQFQVLARILIRVERSKLTVRIRTLVCGKILEIYIGVLNSANLEVLVVNLFIF